MNAQNKNPQYYSKTVHTRIHDIVRRTPRFGFTLNCAGARRSQTNQLIYGKGISLVSSTYISQNQNIHSKCFIFYFIFFAHRETQNTCMRL